MPIIFCSIQMGVLEQKIYVSNNGTVQLLALVHMNSLATCLADFCQAYETDEVYLNGIPTQLEKLKEELEELNIKVNINELGGF